MWVGEECRRVTLALQRLVVAGTPVSDTIDEGVSRIPRREELHHHLEPVARVVQVALRKTGNAKR